MTAAVAIIVAGGSSARFGGAVPKQFVPIAGRTILEWSVARFESAPSIGRIVVVVAADRVVEVEALLRKKFFKVTAVVAGGAQRQDSMACGLVAAAVSDDTVVAVHDAARPLVTPAVIDACVARAAADGAAIVAMPSRDTVKHVVDGISIVRTIPRNEIYLAQTPQAVRAGLLRQAIAAAQTSGAQWTDEAGMLETIGVRVTVVAGPPTNFKITTLDDLQMAEALLAQEMMS